LHLADIVRLASQTGNAGANPRFAPLHKFCLQAAGLEHGLDQAIGVAILDGTSRYSQYLWRHFGSSPIIGWSFCAITSGMSFLGSSSLRLGDVSLEKSSSSHFRRAAHVTKLLFFFLFFLCQNHLLATQIALAIFSDAGLFWGLTTANSTLWHRRSPPFL
jgi:hypothetical protein